MGLKIGITCDLKTDWQFKDGQPVDANAEFDSPKTLELITSAIRAGGHTPVFIGNGNTLLKQVDRLGVDIVFNFCEGYKGRNRESEVPLILEMHDIPFIGADALTLGVTLDKVIAKRVFQGEGIPTPKFFIARDSQDIALADSLQFPLFVKTRYEGTSKGLTDESRVENMDQLRAQIDRIVNTYSQTALVEEFIKGTEFTVPVLGNDTPKAMPVIQVSIDGTVDLGDSFFTYERVVKEETVDYICPAKIPDSLAQRMQELAIQTYKATDCRDFGRVDFRVDKDGNPYVLEINPLPSLAANDVFNIFPQVVGKTYNDVINEIIEYGVKRCGLLQPQTVSIGDVH